jgi:hypothetical protein
MSYHTSQSRKHYVAFTQLKTSACSKMIRIATFSFFNNKIKKCRRIDQARWIRLYPTAALTTTTMTTTTSPPTDSAERPIVIMLLSLAAATTAWLSGGPERTQNEPLSSLDVAAESQSRDPASSPPLPKCGSWCSEGTILQTKCTMDQEIMPCQGVYCQTDCRLWNEFILKKRPAISCDQYKSGAAYPRGGPCRVPQPVYHRNYARIDTRRRRDTVCCASRIPAFQPQAWRTWSVPAIGLEARVRIVGSLCVKYAKSK